MGQSKNKKAINAYVWMKAINKHLVSSELRRNLSNSLKVININSKEKPRILFRCDISPWIGIGHLLRCLTLARELKDHGAFVFFACRSAGIDLAKYLRGIADDWTALDWSLKPVSDVRKAIELYRHHEIDLAVIDHYQAGREYQEQLYRSRVRWLQFDWAASQPLWADWVLNASPAADENFYLSLRQREETCFLLGPAYALLRREFCRWRPQVQFHEQVRKILLTFGGGDDLGATVSCLKAIKSLETSIERVVLVSSANPHFSDIVDWTNRNNNANVTLLVDEEEVASQFLDADLAIIGGGTTTFETAAMGVPSLIIQLSDNQEPNACAWERQGVAVNLGPLNSLTLYTLKRKVSELIKDSRFRWSMSSKARSIVDCFGAQRVAQKMLLSERGKRGKR